jgi:putative transposase
MRMRDVADSPDLGTNGIWMKSSSPFRVSAIISGGRWIRTATCSIFSVQRRRDKAAAKKFFRKLLKGLTYVPRVIITDKLASYGAAKREILPSVEHRQHRYLNNRAENSHQPTRQRERRMQGFKSPGHAQRFLAAYGPIASHFRPRRHRLSAAAYRQEMGQRFQVWREVTGLAPAA